MKQLKKIGMIILSISLALLIAFAILIAVDANRINII